MKINIKSRQTLLVLFLTIVLIGSYLYILSYISENVEKIEQEVNQLDIKYKDLSKRSEKKGEIEKEIKKNSTELNRLSTLLPPEIRQEDMIISLNDLRNSSGLQFINIAFSTAKAIAEQVDKNKTQPDTAKTDTAKTDTAKTDKTKANTNNTTKAKPVKPSNTIEMPDLTGIEVEVNSNFTSNYGQLKQFMRDIENHKSRIVIQKLNLKSSEELGISGSMALKFYGFSDKSLKLDDLNIELNRGKSNPLVP